MVIVASGHPFFPAWQEGYARVFGLERMEPNRGISKQHDRIRILASLLHLPAMTCCLLSSFLCLSSSLCCPSHPALPPLHSLLLPLLLLHDRMISVFPMISRPSFEGKRRMENMNELICFYVGSDVMMVVVVGVTSKTNGGRGQR